MQPPVEYSEVLKLGHPLHEKWLRYKRMADRGHTELRKWKNFLKGETVYVLGNGPSLKSVNPAALDGQNIISTNRGFLYYDKTQPAALWNVVQDAGRIVELNEGFEASRYITFTCPAVASDKILGIIESCPKMRLLMGEFRIRKKGDEWVFAVDHASAARFEMDATWDSLGRSVLFGAIQLGVYLGAREIVLLGCDLDYSGKDTHFTKIEGHYPQGYGYGYEYERCSRGTLLTYRDMCEERGIRLVNATTPSQIDVIENEDLCATIQRSRHELSMKKARNFMRFLKTEQAHGRPCWVWGAGSGAERVKDYLAAHGIAVNGFVDRNEEPGGRSFLGAPVVRLDPKRIYDGAEMPLIVIGTDRFADVDVALDALGYNRDMDYTAHIFQDLVDYTGH
ncbi:MAG: hypothetical protein ACPGN3_05185 [Opitutales bacterium]